jgi:hypothetical protein
MQIKDLKLNYIYSNKYFFYKVIYISKDNDYAIALKYNDFCKDDYIETIILNKNYLETELNKNLKLVEDIERYKLFDEFKIVGGNTIYRERQ